MKWILHSLVWRSALVLLALLGLAALASHTTVSFLETHPDLQGSPGALRIISLMLLALTMGFLFLSGALGIIGIRYAAEVEGRRRVGRFVDAMDYLSDGLVVVDHHGYIVGSNSTARLMGAQGGSDHVPLQEPFAYLSDKDVALLLDTNRPQEVEITQQTEQGARTLRFRSEPSEGVNLLLISDVTGLKARETQRRLDAHLQLIGRVARGVAQDFNNILCAISGHAALMELRGEGLAAGQAASLNAIKKESQRAAGLARQLLDVSRLVSHGAPSERLGDHAKKAADLLRVGLPGTWNVVTDVVGSFPAVPFTGLQLEQFVLNLGLLAAEQASDSGIVHIQVREPHDEKARHSYAAEILISVHESRKMEDEQEWTILSDTSAETCGVIQSVLRSMVEEIGGRLDIFTTSSGRLSYRVRMPAVSTSEDTQEDLAGVPAALHPYIARWSVLLACPNHQDRFELERRLTSIGMTVVSVDDLISALARIEDAGAYSGIVVDQELLGEQVEDLLHAMMKLQPSAGLVLLNHATAETPEGLGDCVVLRPETAPPGDILHALIEARELLGRREHAA